LISYTVDFEDLFTSETNLSGVYQGIDWGQGLWQTGLWKNTITSWFIPGEVTTLQTRTLKFPANSRLVDITIQSDSGTGYVKISSNSNPDLIIQGVSNQWNKYKTNWTNSSETVVISVQSGSGAYDVNFDNFVFLAPQPPIVSPTAIPQATATPKTSPTVASRRTIAGQFVNKHPIVVDSSNKIIPWFQPQENAYSEFLHKRWNFFTTKMPKAPGSAPRSNYPMFYFWDGYNTEDATLTPDWWMNDPGEKIPYLFDSARLYYGFTGNTTPLAQIRAFIDYTLEHGMSPANFAWPNFPNTCANAGDTEFTGFTGRFSKHEVHVDHAGDIGYAIYGMYKYFGDTKYLNAAINIANVLAANARVGTSERSVWPYRVIMDSGRITAEYGANWIGAISLLDGLIADGLGNVSAYIAARDKARTFLLNFPMKTGYWTDGHTDSLITSNTYKSNLSKSSAALYILDNPNFDPNWQSNIPKLINWTVTNFVDKSIENEPSRVYGAEIVGEQEIFMYKMDYQTARHAAELARWYAVSKDDSYKDRAYRGFNWVTYASDANGRCTESPYTLRLASWWGDCYGEAPRMFYHGFAAVPEWAPPKEDHILYSYGFLTDVKYAPKNVSYFAQFNKGIEYLRLTYLPTKILLNGNALTKLDTANQDGWTVRDLSGGDYAVTIYRSARGKIEIQ
jgi:hypothetical protein